MTTHRVHPAHQSLEERQSRIEKALENYAQEITECINECDTARNGVIASRDLTLFSFFDQYKKIEVKLAAMNSLMTFLKMNEDTFKSLVSDK